MKRASVGCSACKNGTEAPFAFSMAFQPIVNTTTQTVFAYEALVRGPQNEPARTVFSKLTEKNSYAFDQSCRVKAITLAAELELVKTGALLSINFMPGAVYSPVACIQLTLKTAQHVGFPLNKLMFEITEAEKVHDRAHLLRIVQEYKRQDFKVALDDMGSGYSGLNLLADLSADVVKLDMDLTRDLHQRAAAQVIVKGMVQIIRSLGSTLIAEGVETDEEYSTLRRCGVELMQGHLFSPPLFEALPVYTGPRGSSRLPCGGNANHPKTI